MPHRHTILRVATLMALWFGLCGCRPHAPPVDFWTQHEDRVYQKLAAEVATPCEICDEGEDVSLIPPATLQTFDQQQPWDLSLCETIRIGLANSRILRQVQLVQTPFHGGAAVPQVADTLLRAPDAAATVYDPALQASSVIGPAIGIQAALSEFDTRVGTTMFWEKNEEPVNVNQPAEQIFARNFLQDRATFRGELAKRTLTGAQLFARHNVVYDLNNNPTRAVPSDYSANYELGITQPFFQGAGLRFNEIAGPGAQPGVYNGVLIARINGDITLADFEASVRDYVSQVETVYWELYLAHRVFLAARTGRDAALQNWRHIEAARRVGRENSVRESQARSEYYRFVGRLQESVCELLATENRLRYLLGLPAGDGRVIRPTEQAELAYVLLDWSEIQLEALARSPELRRQKWRIQQRELELIAARHFLYPRVDGTAVYRWVGAGDDLMGRRSVPPFAGSDAYSTLFGGDYQEWQMGLQMSMPLGFRQGHAAVRNAELRIARERGRLAVQEQELSHLLAEAVRQVDCHYALAITRYNNWQATIKEAESALVAFPLGRIPYSDVLAAFSRRTEAEIDYYRATVNYRRAIVQLHLRKGSLLEFNQVYLAETPWPESNSWSGARFPRKQRPAYTMDYALTGQRERAASSPDRVDGHVAPASHLGTERNALKPSVSCHE